jgi:hypothetical protein
MCCGKVSTVKPKEKNMSAVYVECGHCGYEHVVEIRAGKVAKVSAP